MKILLTVSTLFINRSGVLPTPLPSPPPTLTPTPTITPTLTPTVTPITLVSTTINNAIINCHRTPNARSAGDELWWYYSSDNFQTINRTAWAYLRGSSTADNINVLYDTCFDFKDDDNIVIATRVKTTGTSPGNYNLLKQTIRHRNTWNTPGGLNDIGTNSTTIATWNGTYYSEPFFNAGTNSFGTVDMFVHRNSNTAVYVFTQYGSSSSTASHYWRDGDPGAWYFTVNLANNSISSATKFTSRNLCNNGYPQYNCSDAYYGPLYRKTTKLLRRLPDGKIIFQSLYLTGAYGTAYGAAANIGYYNQSTWNGFTEEIQYVIPNSEFANNQNKIAPAWSEFAALGNNYYLAWCTKTHEQAYGVNGAFPGSSPASLVLRNLQTNVQVNVDTLLMTDGSGSGWGSMTNRLMQPYDIMGIPSSNQIYVVYTKFINYTGNYDSLSNTFGIFLKRYDRNLNLIDTSTLFTFIPPQNAGTLRPALVCPRFSYKVSSSGVLTLILSFGYSTATGLFQTGGTNADIIMTNTPSTNNTWTTRLNRVGDPWSTGNSGSIFYYTEGRTITCI